MTNWMTFKWQLIDWLLTDCWLTLPTDYWMIADWLTANWLPEVHIKLAWRSEMKIESSGQVWTERTNGQTDGRTDGQTLWLIELLSEPKKNIFFLKPPRDQTLHLIFFFSLPVWGIRRGCSLESFRKAARISDDSTLANGGIVSSFSLTWNISTKLWKFFTKVTILTLNP